MPPSRHVLLIERNASPKPVVGKTLRGGPVLYVVKTISDAIRELQSAGYDAVFLQVDGPDELSLVCRIKTAAPDVPIFALIPEPTDELTTLAKESGADQVLPIEREPEAATATMDRVVAGTEELIRRARSSVARSEELRREGWNLIARAKALREDSFDLGKVPLKDLRTLVVDDAPEQILFLKRSFRKLGLPPALPALGNGGEAIAYLAGQGIFCDRTKYPLPTLLLLDLHLPRKDGFEVLRFVRSTPELQDLVVLILTSSTLQEDLDRALSLGADCFYPKPMDLATLDHITRTMAVRWGLIYQARPPRKRS